MADQHTLVMTSPEHYEVCYTINPWMKPDEWARAPVEARHAAGLRWMALAERLREAGMTIEVVPGEPGLPDMVFPANSGIALDGKLLLARFLHPQRQGEAAHFRRFYQGLVERGLLREVVELPEGMIQEGAGDCIWDIQRQLFWVGYGQRSQKETVEFIGQCFGRPVVGLELATEEFYHLDTCFCVLSGGEVLYYPPALSPDSLARVNERVPPEQQIIATADEAAAFSLNAVNIGRDLIMAPPPPRLRALLEGRGYRCLDVDLSSFMLSGGAAYCMTLRLDLTQRRHD